MNRSGASLSTLGKNYKKKLNEIADFTKIAK